MRSRQGAVRFAAILLVALSLVACEKDDATRQASVVLNDDAYPRREKMRELQEEEAERLIAGAPLNDLDGARLHDLLLNIAATDPRRALEMLLSIQQECWRGFDVEVIKAIEESLGRDETLRSLVEGPASPRSGRILTAFFLAIAERYSRLTEGEVEVLSRHWPKVPAIDGRRLFSLMGERDYEYAMAVAGDLAVSPLQRDRIKFGLIELKSRTDPEGAIGDVYRVLDSKPVMAGARETGVLGMAFLGWLSADPEAAWERLSNTPPQDVANMVATVNGLHKMLVSSNREMAADVISKIAPTQSNWKVIERIANEILRVDFEYGVGVVSGLQDGVVKDQFLQNSFEQYFASIDSIDLEGISRWSEVDHAVVERAAVAALARRDAMAALQLASNLDASGSPALVPDVYRVLAAQDPVAAARMMAENRYVESLSAETQLELSASIASSWAQIDLPEALGWVDGLVPELRASGVKGVMTRWSISDPIAASEWLAQQPAGEARDAGARVLIEQLANVDPERAAAWKESLAPGRR